MAAAYRKRAVTIMAEQFDGSLASARRVLNWMNAPTAKLLTNSEDDVKVLIPTPEGDLLARAGDWIICGVAGEFYPCKPAVFEATYEKA